MSQITEQQPVSPREYHNFVSAQVTFSSKEENWNDIFLTRHQHPDGVEGNPRPATTGHILGFMESGSQKGEYRYGGSDWRQFSSSRGDWILQQAYENVGVDFRWRATSNKLEKVSSTLVHVSPQLLSNAAEQFYGVDAPVVELPHRISFKDSVLENILFRLKQQAFEGEAKGNLYVETLSYFLAIHLVESYSTVYCRKKTYCNRLSATRLAQVTDFMHENYHRELSLDMLSNVSNLSPFHFGRVFKQHTGESPHQYLMKIRIEKACFLLQQSSAPIMEISQQVGYLTPGSFSTAFRQVQGCSPSAFRQR